MASSEPCVGLEVEQDRRAVPALAASNAVVLPSDALYEILLWLPAKDLGRLRAVCRPWRSLFSDPRFIAAHAARHPPLIVAGYPTGVRNRRFLFDIVDLSGRVVKRVRATMGKGRHEWATSTQRDLVGIVNASSETFQLLDPATGAVRTLPYELAQEHRARQADMFGHQVTVVYEQVASTREYKVLRIFHGLLLSPLESLIEIFTLDGGIHSHGWRKAKACPTLANFADSRAVLNGVVYFFENEYFLNQDDASSKCIIPFDFATEEWTAALRGPLINHVGGGAALAALSGSLAVVHCVAASSSMDLWFLMDFEKSLWVKRHSIQVNLSAGCRREFSVVPLLVLNDGRILTLGLGDF